MDSRLAMLHTAMPGVVESYDAAKQTADVKPQLMRAVDDGDGGVVVEELPTLPNVPVLFGRGGGFFASFPLAKGDMVLLVFCERDTGQWRSKGEATDPADRRLHPLSGAVALPGFYPDSKALGSAHAENMVVGKDGSSAVIHMKPDGTVHLGGETGAEFVALADKVLARLDSIKSDFNGHTHGGGTSVCVINSPWTGASGNPSTGIPPTTMSSPASVAATKVKAT
jgi:hypothetical protein